MSAARKLLMASYVAAILVSVMGTVYYAEQVSPSLIFSDNQEMKHPSPPAPPPVLHPQKRLPRSEGSGADTAAKQNAPPARSVPDSPSNESNPIPAAGVPANTVREAVPTPAPETRVRSFDLKVFVRGQPLNSGYSFYSNDDVLGGLAENEVVFKLQSDPPLPQGSIVVFRSRIIHPDGSVEQIANRRIGGDDLEAVAYLSRPQTGKQDFWFEWNNKRIAAFDFTILAPPAPKLAATVPNPAPVTPQ